jgi:SAM-dependent methyltransferase
MADHPAAGGPAGRDPDAGAPAGVDARRANVARVYDYWLGGTENFQADRDLARQILAVEPSVRAIARANRDFLGRAVRFLCGAGIRQFLDIGSGIPTQGNVHAAAQAADPQARVVYADIDPVAIAHSRAILAENPNAAAIQADLRDPAAILADDTTRRLIDFRRPVGLLLVAVLHFIADAEEPARLVATLRDALAPGLVSGPEWRPDPAAVARGEAGQMWGLLAGVGRKP